MRSSRPTGVKRPPTVRRFRAGFRWGRIELEPYKATPHRGGEFCGASRQVLVGKMGEQVAFHLRYFELEPGGFTSLERHHHAHVVIAMTGCAIVRVGGRRHKIVPFDAVYIGPDEPHQLSADQGEKFGFLCIVNARRDRPRALR